MTITDLINSIAMLYNRLAYDLHTICIRTKGMYLHLHNFMQMQICIGVLHLHILTLNKNNE